ncbi:MAG: hypothetical protein AAF490_02965 [Chloroflexota bacterium]
MNNYSTTSVQAPDPTEVVLNRIEKLSRDLCLYQVWDQWDVYRFNGWLTSPPKPIPLSSPHAPTLENLEKGQGLFWTIHNGNLYPYFIDLVLASLHQRDQETLPFLGVIQ